MNGHDAAATAIRVERRLRGFHLHPVELPCEDPGLTLLLGDNGAGKTTLLTAYEAELRERGRSVALLPQNFHLPLATRVRTLVALFRTPRCPHPVPRLLEMTGLEGQAGKRVFSLSGGMRRRLGVALCLARGARTLILDEPCAGLDTNQRDVLAAVLKGLASETSVMVSSHHMEDFLPHADRVILLSHGRTAFHGTPAELRATVESGDAREAYRVLAASA